MVKTLHREGIEVIIDVVYNHTGEETTWDPRCAFEELTTPRTTVWWRIVATTWITPAVAIP